MRRNQHVWQLAAVGDFNGDSKPDYVLYNAGISEFAGPPFFQKLRGKRRDYDCAVVANRFDRATFHRFFTECFLFRGFWLFVNVGMTAVVIAFETGGCRFAAQIAVDALIVDVEFSCYVFGVFVCDLSHSFYGKGEVQC
jgi:hypothetical protein